MRAELRDGRTRYVLQASLRSAPALNAKAGPVHTTETHLVRFRDAWEARQFLTRFEHDPLAQLELRKIHAALRDDVVPTGDSFTTLIGELSDAVARDALEIEASQLAAPAGIALEPPAPQEPDLRPPPIIEQDHWIKIKVVLDATGDPIPGVEVRVRQPDGHERNYETRADGVVEVQEIDPGVCAASGPLNVGAQRVEDTWHVVGMGAAPIEPEREPVANPRGGHLAVIDEHKVSDGETIDSLARAAGATWQDLSKFNWGTSNPNQINENLRDVVGCTKKTADGHNYVFTSDDDPGIMFIPQAWSEDGLATNTEHIVRVRRATVEQLVDWEFSV